MDTDRYYINQREPEDDLYTRLQQESLDELQHLSGEVWTDYNEHDPGITTVDIINYTLTEMDYRLHYPAEDYLRTENIPFNPQSKGLFPPEMVFPTQPITEEDYRKLLIRSIPELNYIWVKTNPKGLYTFYSWKFPETDTHELGSQIYSVYHAHRNLCENMDKTVWITPMNLTFHAEVQLAPDANAEKLLATLFYEIRTYLNGEIRFRLPDEMISEGISPDIWMDGPDLEGIRTEIVPLEKDRTESKLYKKLLLLEGIITIHSCHFTDESGQWINLFDKPFTVVIPSTPEDLHVTLHKNDKRINIVWEGFLNYFKEMIQPSQDYRKGWNTAAFKDSLSLRELLSAELSDTQGSFHDMYKHYSIMNDFPVCYGVHPHGREKKNQAEEQRRQFQSYLLLFDLVFIRGVKELANLDSLMTLAEILPNYTVTQEVISQSLPESLLKELISRSGQEPEGMDVLRMKENILDRLDQLYDEESDPIELTGYHYEEENRERRLLRRIHFLKKVPEWGKNRLKAMDITQLPADNTNVSGLKARISAWLGWQTDERYITSNLLPGYNLTLSEQFNAELIPGMLLQQENMENIQPEEVPEIHIEELRTILPVFNENKLYYGLLRNGILASNYRIIPTRGTDYALICFNQEKQNWMSLGRSADKVQLNRQANHLLKFLLKINQDAEVMYVIEHCFFRLPQPFSLTVAVTGWTVRTADPSFRKIFYTLLLKRIPAHLKFRLCWLDPTEMKTFEVAWLERDMDKVQLLLEQNYWLNYPYDYDTQDII